ncbi:protein NO VEIN domain-containing protein [Cellulosimicrobium marinum]|uniref:protein NO VEIN domain-containing protein n=1 Tax=Cellulosimicrobium marinum TaxID=1638992 RepID=UPI001E475426|nr:DUF3883 domain-containing protein [Cellulosimicrobium marinum]MCB7137921.1 DUF3883 domain-containing protein [Cellulosimicrobium marinum]
MVVTFERLRDAEAAVPACAGYSTTAGVVDATLRAVFGADVAGTLRAVNQPLETVAAAKAMRADIGGLECTVYADPQGVNVLTPGTRAERHLRAHARPGSEVRADRRGDTAYAMVGYAWDDLAELVDVVDAEALADAVAGRTPRRALITSAADRRAIEERAVGVATEHFEAIGYQVANVGATASYDLDCRRGDEHLYVEVKGTTTGGEAVILTRNEVELHRATYPRNALALVRRIRLDRSCEPPAATDGELLLTQPWQIDDESLTALSYRFATGVDG